MSNVLKISEACSLAIHAAAYIASNDGTCLSTREIAEKLGASENHLSKVLQRLTREGILNAVRGPKGGFVLVKPAEDIKLLELFELFEGKLPGVQCLLGKPACNGDKCVLGGMLNKINKEVYSYLDTTRVADLINVFSTERNSKEKREITA